MDWVRQGITAVEGLRKPEGCSTGDCARDHAPDEKSTTKRHLRHKSHRAKHIEEQGIMRQFMAHFVLDKWMIGFFVVGFVITLMLWQPLVLYGNNTPVLKSAGAISIWPGVQYYAKIKGIEHPWRWSSWTKYRTHIVTCNQDNILGVDRALGLILMISHLVWTWVFSLLLTTIKNFVLSKLSKAKPGQSVPGQPIFNGDEVRSYLHGCLCGCVALYAEAQAIKCSQVRADRS